MPRFSEIRLLLSLAALMALLPARSIAQDDPNETPLGDIARSLRNKTAQKTAPTQKVIDDDNLPQVMEQGESRRGFGSSLRYLMAGDGKGFQVSAPDATCSLSFTSNVKSLLSGQYSQMEMPAPDVAKLEGPATVEGDALTVSVFNGTNWHVSEVAVALTVVKRRTALAELGPDSALEEIRPEKKQDVTVIYRMRAAAPPWERVVFSAPLNLELAPGDEWHWAIVQAKGYPPQGIAEAAAAASSSAQARPQSTSAPVAPQGQAPASLSQDLQ
jgi:hypothetical protein